MRQKRLIYYWLILLVSLLANNLQAQRQYPVTTSTVVQAPYSVFLKDYYESGSNRLATTLVLQDFNQPSVEVYLRMTITNGNILLRSRTNYRPSQPITLTPGVAVRLADVELEDYFNYNHLDFQGISVGDLSRDPKLPEGLYQFCFEVIEYQSGKVLSNRSCASVWITLHDPPRIIQPQCGTYIAPMNPQQIPLQWQVTAAGSPNASQNIEYKLDLYEITQQGVDPVTAINNNQVLKIFESAYVTQAMYLYGLNEPILDAGKQYVYTITAIDARGLDQFKNGGVSQPCSFWYGYPIGGKIELREPVNETGFRQDTPNFFKWGKPSLTVPGQRFSYRVAIVKMNAGQTKEDAVDNNPIWHEERTIETSSLSDYSVRLTKDLEPMVDYAWQVTAYSGNQEVAKSEAFQFKGPPVLQKFRAGNYDVYVTSTKDGDVSKLSGTAKIQIGPKKEDIADAKFSNITLEQVSGRYVLKKGYVIYDIPSPEAIELTAKVNKNPNATFTPSQIRVGPEDMEIQGDINWPLAHAVTSGEKGIVKMSSTWLKYNTNKEVSGTAKLKEGNVFELLEPYGFALALDTTSSFIISNNEFFVKMHGQLQGQKNIQNSQGNRAGIAFFNADQLHYIKVSESTMRATGTQADFALVDKTKMALRAKEAVIDLSEEESPSAKSGEKDWKGIYYDAFSVIFYKDLDENKQILLTRDYIHEVKADDKQMAVIDAAGMNCKFTIDFKGKEAMKFNQFEGTLSTFNYERKPDGSMNDSYFTGRIKIPFFHPDSTYRVHAPLAIDGIKRGYLLDGFSSERMVVSQKGAENPLYMTVKQAAFAENERLELVIDVDVSEIKAKIDNLYGLRLWGNGQAGFGKPNSVIPIPSHTAGVHKDIYQVSLDSIGIGIANNVYAFSILGTIKMGEDITGYDGPPRYELFTGRAISDDVNIAYNYLSGLSTGVPLAQNGRLNNSLIDYSIEYYFDVTESGKSGGSGGNNRYRRVDLPITTMADAAAGYQASGVYIKLDLMAIYFEGMWWAELDDPVYGDYFSGGIVFKSKIPLIPFEAELRILSGKTNDGDFYLLVGGGFGESGVRDPELSAFVKAKQGAQGIKNTAVTVGGKVKDTAVDAKDAIKDKMASDPNDTRTKTEKIKDKASAAKDAIKNKFKGDPNDTRTKKEKLKEGLQKAKKWGKSLSGKAEAMQQKWRDSKSSRDAAQKKAFEKLDYARKKATGKIPPKPQKAVATGIPIPGIPALRITSIWARVYHKMSYNLDWALEDRDLSIEPLKLTAREMGGEEGEHGYLYVPDPKVAFGMTIKLRIVDAKPIPGGGSQSGKMLDLHLAASLDIKGADTNFKLMATARIKELVPTQHLLKAHGSLVIDKKGLVADIYVYPGSSVLKVICIENAYAHLEINDEHFHLDIGTQEKKISVKPFCLDFKAVKLEFKGYFGIDVPWSNPLQARTWFGASVFAEVDVSTPYLPIIPGIAKANLNFYASLYLAFDAALRVIPITPYFILEKIKAQLCLEVDISIGVKVKILGSPAEVEKKLTLFQFKIQIGMSLDMSEVPIVMCGHLYAEFTVPVVGKKVKGGPFEFRPELSWKGDKLVTAQGCGFDFPSPSARGCNPNQP